MVGKVGGLLDDELQEVVGSRELVGDRAVVQSDEVREAIAVFGPVLLWM